MTRRAVWMVALLGLVVAAAYVTASRRSDGPPLDPSSTAPDGTKALVQLVDRLGGSVDVVDGVPGGDVDVALVLEDRLPREQADELEAWTRAGGLLVVADPSSLLTPPIGGAVFDTIDGGCSFPLLRDVATLDVGEARAYRSPLGVVGCFAVDGGSFVTYEPFGQGTIVSVGGPGLFTNRLLDEADNAVLAGALLAGDGRRMAFVRPGLAGSGDRTLGDLVDTPVRAALFQLLVAFGVVVLWRSRRLGRPVEEHQLVRIEGSELTRAVGRLLETNRHPARAAADLRDRARRDLSGPLGLPLDATVDSVVETIERRTTLTAHQARRAVAEPVVDDATLVDVALLLTRIREEISHDRPANV